MANQRIYNVHISIYFQSKLSYTNISYWKSKFLHNIIWITVLSSMNEMMKLFMDECYRSKL